MELYYKDLISEEASLEKLVDDLMLVVQGANELAEATGATNALARNQDLKTRLEGLKKACAGIKKQTVRSALAADKLLRQYPYTIVGFAFSFGVLAGFLSRKRR